MPATQIFRLFISSTFSDFIAERAALQKHVFPKLVELCRERGATFEAIDLRWGITEEAQREHDTMRICLEEVRRCQELSPRPNFAVLLGDRYGWEPVPARIPQDHWKRLIAAASPTDRKLIRDGYRGPDRNAVPPVWHLHKRKGNWSESASRENAVREALRRAAVAAGFKETDRRPYFASATHQEIALGAFDAEHAGDAAEHVHVYVRRIEGLPQDASARTFIDWDSNVQEPMAGARDRLRELEGELRLSLPGRVREFTTSWTGQGIETAYLENFCARFLEDQKAIIERELAKEPDEDEAQVRERPHKQFAAERARNFRGRVDMLRQIDRYLKSSGNAPLVVHGEGGTGKSALMARAYLNASSDTTQSVVITRFIGGVPGTESLMKLLTDLTADIASAFGQLAPPTSENIKAAREAFALALQLPSMERPLAIFLDALDQLDRTDGAWLLEWLPKELGEHTRIVASTRGAQVLLSAQRRYPKSLLALPTMKPDEARQMLKAWLEDPREAHYNAGIAPLTRRTLTVKQRTAILNTFANTARPLWLKLAYEEARSWPSWYADDDPQKLNLPETVEAMVQDLIGKRLIEGENHPAVFTERALAYLAAGRFGLSDEELGRALATDPLVREEFNRQNESTGQRWESEETLPPILWSRLYFDLQPYLTQARMDGAVLHRWFHREFKKEITRRCMGTEDDRKRVRRHLAATFQALAPLPDSTQIEGQNVAQLQSAALRRIREEWWQYSQARDSSAAQGAARDALQKLERSAPHRNSEMLIELFNYLTDALAKRKDIDSREEAITLQSRALRILRNNGSKHDLNQAAVIVCTAQLFEREARILQNRLISATQAGTADSSSPERISFQTRMDDLYAKAQRGYRRAISIRSLLLGAGHSATRSAQQLLDDLLARIGSGSGIQRN